MGFLRYHFQFRQTYFLGLEYKIIEDLYSIYYNPKSGVLSPYKMYLKLNKKVPLRKIEAFVKKQEVWQMKQPRIIFMFIHAIIYGRLI